MHELPFFSTGGATVAFVDDDDDGVDFFGVDSFFGVDFFGVDSFLVVDSFLGVGSFLGSALTLGDDTLAAFCADFGAAFLLPDLFFDDRPITTINITFNIINTQNYNYKQFIHFLQLPNHYSNNNNNNNNNIN